MKPRESEPASSQGGTHFASSSLIPPSPCNCRFLLTTGYFYMLLRVEQSTYLNCKVEEFIMASLGGFSENVKLSKVPQ